MFLHEVGREFSCAIERPFPAIAAMFAHFDADAILVSWTIVIGMVALLRGRHVLNGNTVLYREMPNDGDPRRDCEAPAHGHRHRPSNSACYGW